MAVAGQLYLRRGARRCEPGYFNSRGTGRSELIAFLNRRVREKEVIALLAEGLGLAETADALGISYRAARARVDRARERIGARTTPELVRVAVLNGDVPLT